jgi:hypothetical protein
MGLNRRTVKKYLSQVVPCRVEEGARPHPVLATVGPQIEAVLAEWRPRLGGKHRLTSVRLHRELVAREIQVGKRTVRRYLAEKRRAQAEVYIPLVHRPGDEAQVDFFEVTVRLKGVLRKVWKLLIVDELGFVPFKRDGGELLFNLLADRYERRSTIVTTNLAFAEWVQVFGDEKLTTALLDRLAHHAHILTTKGVSFRTRRRKDTATVLSSKDEPKEKTGE